MKTWKKATMSCMMAAMVLGAAACGGEIPDNVVKDYYEITVACQSEDSEKKVLEVLAAAYTAKNPDTKIKITTFSGKDFENYMLGLAQNRNDSPNIIWTSDSYHGRWDNYFTDLRPFYERSAETDYSLYYEAMLDTASQNGYFKPTKNYTGEFRKNDLDTNSDGLESYSNHSPYGLYYAPRDYNKPAVLCNTHIFKKLDERYEAMIIEEKGALPADYQSTMDRMDAIVAGEDWNEAEDLFAYARVVAERITYILNTVDQKLLDDSTPSDEFKKLVSIQNEWQNISVADLKLGWEPSYVTLLTGMGVTNIVNEDGSLGLASHKDTLERLHGLMYPDGVRNLYYSEGEDASFAAGRTMMRVVSRPVVLGFIDTFTIAYGSAGLQCLQFPVEAVAAGNSGYAINNYYHGKGVTVNGVYKSYDDMSWDFIKYIITEEGQEVAGATGNNIPVMKKLYDKEANGGVEPAWRKVEELQGMNHDAWVAGAELKQDWFNIYNARSRTGLRGFIQQFFNNFQKSNYMEGSLDALLDRTNKNYNSLSPTKNLL